MEQQKTIRSKRGKHGVGPSVIVGSVGPAARGNHWRDDLADFLAEGSLKGKVVIVGMGHPLRGDDFVGSLIAKDLARRTNLLGRVNVVDVEDSLENISRTLRECEPQLLILIDALDAGAAPGSICLVDLSATSDSFFTTHNMPLQLVLRAGPKVPRVLLLGVQPRTLDVGGRLSDEVQHARVNIVDELVGILDRFRSAA